ncbi:hypothetical protein CLPUN_47070 [Clostridium puniceum]|uniref:Uncharacterized protein n=1 Tax=Clostridium puniceum TaxID=29367 RepID=A0A1S8T3L6_9CLOT|nr:hypothetical protein [Clostridium puniceum]OOM72239.1 hypothetical protein CLPUN_47070 [Clostridium puniceum]
MKYFFVNTNRIINKINLILLANYPNLILLKNDLTDTGILEISSGSGLFILVFIAFYSAKGKGIAE